MKTDSSGFFDAADIEPSKFSLESGNYIIGEEIYSSEKGFTKINLVRRLGRLFIAKSLRAKYREDMVAQSALRKEFEIGFAVDCPGSVRTFDFPTDPELGSFIVLEYCRGENLRQFLTSGRELSGDMLRKVADSLISTLRILHSQGIIHRDIKPSNIIFDEISGSVKLIDFGCADRFDQLMFKGPAGTELYQSDDFANLPAADWYALSLSLSELLGHCSDPKATEYVSSLCAIMRDGRDPEETSSRRPGRRRLVAYLLGALTVLTILVSSILYYSRQEASPLAAGDEKQTEMGDIKVVTDSLAAVETATPAPSPLSPEDGNPLPSAETVSSPSEKAPEPSAPSSEPKTVSEPAATARETEKTPEPAAAVAPHEKKLLPPEEVAVGMSPYVADSVYNTNIGYMHNRVMLICRTLRGGRRAKEERLAKQYSGNPDSLQEELKRLYDKETIKEDVYKKVLPLPLGVSRDSVMKIINHYVERDFQGRLRGQ